MRRTVVNDSVPVEAADCWLWQQSRRIKRSEQRGEHVVDFVETSAECPTECPTECPRRDQLAQNTICSRCTAGDAQLEMRPAVHREQIVFWEGAEDEVLPFLQAV